MKDLFKLNPKNTLLISCFLSNFLEFYDFALYGAFVIPMSKDFFLNDGLSSVLSGLTIFGVAFFARPFGSMFFGYIGDTKGRKIALTSSIMIMGVFTSLIGCIPPATKIGILAPILLIICRLAQGFALGGESNGSFILLLEKLNNRRGLAGSLVLASGTMGFIAATYIGIIFTRYNISYLNWRIPFCTGIIVGVAGVIIRSLINESEIFLDCKKYSSVMELITQIIKHYKPSLRVIGISGVNGVLVYMLSSYISVYLNKFVLMPLHGALFYTQIGLITCLITVPLGGYLSDIISYKKVMTYACYFTAIAAFFIPMFLYLGDYVMTVIVLAMLIGAFNGPTPALINEFFPANLKYSAISISFSIGTACFGGITPLACTYLTKHLHTVFAITPYLLTIAIIAYISVTGASSSKDQKYVV